MILDKLPEKILEAEIDEHTGVLNFVVRDTTEEEKLKFIEEQNGNLADYYMASYFLERSRAIDDDLLKAEFKI